MITANENETVYWNSFSKDNGRPNYVVVTYTDKNGQLQTKRYNYVYKNANYNDENGNPEVMDVENGFFYLAEISENGEVKRITDSVFNLDNYSELLAAHKMLQDTAAYEAQYQAAQDAVKAALDEVNAIQAEIERLRNIKGVSNIQDLYKALEDARPER